MATLTLLLNYTNEDDFVVWDELASSVSNMRYESLRHVAAWSAGRGELMHGLRP